jgi:hypothetical protein
MSTVYRFKIDYPIIEVEAESLEKARELAADRQDQLSGSNTGSEMIANAELEFIGTYECNHEETRDYTFNSQKQNRDKSGWRKVKTTYTHCKKCNKLLNEVEVDVPSKA